MQEQNKKALCMLKLHEKACGNVDHVLGYRRDMNTRERRRYIDQVNAQLALAKSDEKFQKLQQSKAKEKEEKERLMEVV
jgi:hypothetical protein